LEADKPPIRILTLQLTWSQNNTLQPTPPTQAPPQKPDFYGSEAYSKGAVSAAVIMTGTAVFTTLIKKRSLWVLV
jgi:hypothetical protein